MKVRLCLLLLALFAVVQTLSAQTLNVKGTVLDSSDEPVVGASVFVKGTRTGT